MVASPAMIVAAMAIAFPLQSQAEPVVETLETAAGAYSKPVGSKPRPAFERLLSGPDPIEMDRLLPALLDAIRELSQYPVPDALPNLFRIPREALEAMSCVGKCAVQANYRPGEGIYLSEDLQPETNLFARSVLLHELVHYIQDLREVRAHQPECLRWYYREVEAYNIQRRFLLRIGSPIRVGYLPDRTACNNELNLQPTTTLYDE